MSGVFATAAAWCPYKERPADVLLLRASDVRSGAEGRVDGRVALDVGIVCPQASSHAAAASQESLGAAEEYVRQKCGRREMESRCRSAGMVFQPMIFESLGGVSSEAEGVIKSLNRAVAENEDSRESEVARRFWWGLSIDIQKAQHRAFAKRIKGLGYGDDREGGGYSGGAGGMGPG